MLLELARRGVSREQAYEWVQRNAMRSFDEQRDFKALLLADADMSRVLPRAEIERAFDLDEQLGTSMTIFDRVSRGRQRPVPDGLMRARVFVTLKPSVFDPQGTTIADALHSLGYAASRTSGRASTSSSTSTQAEPRRRGGWRRKSRQAAGQSGDRELSHRGGMPDAKEAGR